MRGLLLSGVIVGVVLLAGSGAFAQNSWVGKKVMPKQGASFKLDNGRDMWDVTRLPATVDQIKGDWLWVGRAWIKSSQVVPLDQALDYYSDWIRREPTSATAHSLRGTVWETHGQIDKKINDLTEAIRLEPKIATYRNNRGTAWNNKKEYENAIRDFTEAIRLDPKYASPYMNRGTSWYYKNEYDRAIKDYTEAIRLDPKSASAYVNRGNAWKEKKGFEKALSDYSEGMRLDAKFANAYTNRAWLRATCSDSRFRDGRQAVKDATKACELTNWKDANWIDTLAAAYAESGDFSNAVKWQNKAIELNSKGDGYKDRLALYEQGKPFRDVPK